MEYLLFQLEPTNTNTVRVVIWGKLGIQELGAKPLIRLVNNSQDFASAVPEQDTDEGRPPVPVTYRYDVYIRVRDRGPHEYLINDVD